MRVKGGIWRTRKVLSKNSWKQWYINIKQDSMKTSLDKKQETIVLKKMKKCIIETDELYALLPHTGITVKHG